MQVVRISPNPVSTDGILTIVAEGWDGSMDIEITDFTGRVIRKLNGQFENSIMGIHLPDLNPGVYIIRLQNGNKSSVKKFIVN